jgi:hypothetical protein
MPSTFADITFVTVLPCVEALPQANLYLPLLTCFAPLLLLLLLLLPLAAYGRCMRAHVAE